jgi:hypothetical protein
MDIKELAKSIVKDTVRSFTTDSLGGFYGIEHEDYDYSEIHLRVKDFYSKYRSTYNVEDNKSIPPFCYIMHVLGVTEKLRTPGSFNNEEFLTCLVELYRECGVTEIKKD